MKIITLMMALFAVANAKINVQIIAADKLNDSQVFIYGSEVSIISQKEVSTFQLNDKNLKNAVKEYKGASPNDVFFHDPTRLGNIYQEFGWTPVTRTLKPVNCTINNITSHYKLVHKDIFKNNSTKKATYKTDVQTEVENTVISMWHNYGEITLNNTINYGIDILATSFSGKSTFSYVSKWGEQISQSEKVTVGSKTGIDVDLEPGQELIAEIYATWMSMQVEIDYEASLSGSVFANYEEPFEGHHFYSFDINKVCSAGNLTCVTRSNEVIDLAYVVDSTVKLREVDINIELQKDVYHVPNKYIK